MELQTLIRDIWAQKGETLTEELLFARLRADGGLDASSLTKEQVKRLLNEQVPDNWRTVTFTCSEILAYYVAVGGNASIQQLAAAAFTACVLADAARAEDYDWSLEQNKLLKLAATMGERTPLELNLAFLRYIFGKGGSAPMRD